MSAFDGIFGSRTQVGGSGDLLDESFQKSYPTLHLLMTCTVDPPRAKRQVCTLTIVTEDGVVKAGLRERNHGLSLWVSCESILGVFAALEEALTARPVDWRKVEWNGKRGKP